MTGDASHERELLVAQARLELADALRAAPAASPATDRFRTARQVLLRVGAAALQSGPAAAPGLAEIIEQAACAAPGPARRAFAIVLVDALAVPGLLSVRSSQARLDRSICALVESALPDVLLRGGYPFTGDPDAKRRSLTRLAASIDDYLRPPEPTFPAWLSGLPEP